MSSRVTGVRRERVGIQKLGGKITTALLLKTYFPEVTVCTGYHGTEVVCELYL